MPFLRFTTRALKELHTVSRGNTKTTNFAKGKTLRQLMDKYRLRYHGLAHETEYPTEFFIGDIFAFQYAGSNHKGMSLAGVTWYEKIRYDHACVLALKDDGTFWIPDSFISRPRRVAYISPVTFFASIANPEHAVEYPSADTWGDTAYMNTLLAHLQELVCSRSQTSSSPSPAQIFGAS